MPTDKKSDNTNAGDSAPADTTVDNKKNSSQPRARNAQGRGGGGRNKDPTSSAPKSESSGSKITPGFTEGNSVLNSYGLSVSGYRERVLSPFKADKFFHFVEQSYTKLVEVKPSISQRFSFAEFRHASALQLYQRLEAVKFDALGVRPSAPTRIPLPRNLRVFQPIWSVLANIGIVNDDELRVQYIPDSVLPDSDDLDSEHDIDGLLSCTLYDWSSSWKNVKNARSSRAQFAYRDGMNDSQSSNEPPRTKSDIVKLVQDSKRSRKQAQDALALGIAKIIDGNLYHFPVAHGFSSKGFVFDVTKHKRSGSRVLDVSVSDEDLKKQQPYNTPDDFDLKIDQLMDEARAVKEKAITPRFDVSYLAESYQVSDGKVTTDPGAYGSRLHWDPQLWLDYENFVNEVAQICLFSLSMPNETTGTYAWLLPVEKRQGSESEVFAKMPKASIPPVTWILALLLQSSTLPESRRSTFYCETDVLGNVLGLRQRYINSAVKPAAPTEQYGTY